MRVISSWRKLSAAGRSYQQLEGVISNWRRMLSAVECGSYQRLKVGVISS